MSHVTHWFNEFVRLFKDVPNVFVSDMSSVLLNSAAKAFGGCADVPDYIDWLFNTIRNPDSNTRNVKCFIRIDVAHLVKNITTCDALKLKSSEQREFFIRATCLIVKCSGIIQAETILRSILIVAKSETQGEPFSAHKSYLDDLISNDEPIITASNATNEFQDEVGDIIDDANIQPSSSVKDWLTEINRSTTEEAMENSDDNDNNDLKNLNFVKFLLRLSESVVLWSGVAATHFSAPPRASSAHVESHFKHLKNDLQSVIPARPDEAVVAYIDLIDGMVVDASQNYIEFVDAQGGVKQLLADHTELIDEIDENENCNSEESDDNTESIQKNGVAGTKNKSHVAKKSCATCKGSVRSAYRCIDCDKPIHLLSRCSKSAGYEECIGELRICISCDVKVHAEAAKQPTKKVTRRTEKPITEEINDYDSYTLETSKDETESIQDNAVSKNQNKNLTIEISCVACKRGDAPGGAHRCRDCGKAVHPFDGCSNSCGGEEGYGEVRICISCAAKASGGTASTQPTKRITRNTKKSNAEDMAKRLNEKEKWEKKSTSNGFYLNSVPAWNIDKRVRSKPTIKFLINGNKSTTLYKIGKKFRAMRNTCAFDTLGQVGVSLEYIVITTNTSFNQNFLSITLFFFSFLQRCMLIFPIAVYTWMRFSRSSLYSKSA